MVRWAWDQGRVVYMEFPIIRAMAGVLAAFENFPLNESQEDLRSALSAATGLSFASGPNEVWRNYRGVFARALLAARVEDRLITTDVCGRLAEDPDGFNSDDYFSFLIPRFYVPSPASAAYRPGETRVFPFCALLRYLLSQRDTMQARASLDDVFSVLIGNDCRGDEDVGRYAAFPRTGYAPHGDEERQVRELVRFLGQFTPVTWINPHLFLQIPNTEEARRALEQLSVPLQLPQAADSASEILRLGSMEGWSSAAVQEVVRREEEIDEVVVEGVRRSVIHSRVERSARVRRLYFASTRPPYLCDMCQHDLARRYPWTDNLLQVHHVLPLGSTLYATDGTTLLRDVVGMCPNCHVATHRFYGRWLQDQGRSDFSSRDEARVVYEQAKDSVAA